ncbi:hypothetical protein EXE46_11720 [Halorubrum sp. GN11_10-6_MGM]|uniref:hypothetical protein n=1 Tax=Halorubrum sp. GN11_10-6_MGM TaxID=2518112 RepID=UPI0010F829B1|nr:hypothetical protein [Halorubrum sp. GN11_10-6_MGM]TKX73911.1 hypothetical protein EXE46_11720 [Halorubrum sp. GN11_10-6_MGM]
MASRDPTELKEELGNVDFGGDTEQLVELRSEARETVNAQRETLNDIDTKASKILRLNVALIGILISVLSIAIQVGPESETGLGNVEPFVNLYTEIGIGALVLSTAFAAMTYTASELDVGVSSDNLTNLLKAEFTRDETEELLVKNYIMRINFNRSTNLRNIPLIQLTIVLIVTAIVSFVLGIYEGVSGSVPIWLWLSSIGLLGGVVWVSGLVTQVHRAIVDIQEWR